MFVEIFKEGITLKYPGKYKVLPEKEEMNSGENAFLVSTIRSNLAY